MILLGLRGLAALARIALGSNANSVTDLDSGLGCCFLADSHGCADNLVADYNGICCWAL